MTVVHGLNVLFAAIAALAAFGSLNKMDRGTASFAMKWTFATLGAAMFGQVFILLFPEKWQLAINTLAYGGVAALLIGSQRAGLIMPPSWIRPAVMTALGVTWVAFLIGIRA